MCWFQISILSIDLINHHKRSHYIYYNVVMMLKHILRQMFFSMTLVHLGFEGQVAFVFHATFLVIWHTVHLTLSSMLKGGRSGIMAVFTHSHPNGN